MALTVAYASRIASHFARGVTASVIGFLFALSVTGSARADWWSENVEIHGKANSSAYFSSASLQNDIQMTQWWTQLELDFDVDLYKGESNSLGFHLILLPTYDAVYDVYPKMWGDRRDDAALGTQFPPAGPLNAELAMAGDKFPGHGSGIGGQYFDVNQDTAFLYTGHNNPQRVIDNTVFFGILGAQTRTRNASAQGKLGGGSSMSAFQQAARGAAAGNPSFQGTIAAGVASHGWFAPLHSFGGDGRFVIGDRRSAEEQLPAGLNYTDGQMKTRCFDQAHPYCWAREFYLEAKVGDAQLRVGRQQIVWGKTDAFRLQDLVNPIDFGYHNVYPSLEERRIPVLAADFIYSFGEVLGMEDVSLELVWVFDKFTPVQVGQCGDAWAFTAACEARADFGAHGLLNVSGAKVENRNWNLHNTEPGFRLEWRLPEPSIAFSFSGFWGIQDIPVARFVNHYSTTNPNPAMMMFLMSVNPALDGIFGGPFDPYNAGQVQAASDFALNNVWIPSAAGCDGLTGQARLDCYGAFQIIGWTWSSSQAIVEYPRTFTLGGSLDYQIPNIDTVLRFEVAYDLGRKFNNTRKFDGIDQSDVFMAAIGLDRSFFIPFLNKDRTAFLSFQTFIEHVMNFEGDSTSGMIAHENNIISTFFMENYWRSDSIVLTTFFAYDWAAKAWITGPKLKWIYNENLYFEAGVNLLQGSQQRRNIRDICPSGGYECLGNPATWNAGNWQIINEGLRRTAEAPWWGLESFADNHMEERDEIWLGVTYQF